MQRTGPSNKYLQELVKELKTLSIEKEIKLWKRVASDLEKPTRKRRVVNVSTLNQHTSEDDVVVVPGKVLGTGTLDHKLTVAAQAFSDSAKKTILEAKGKVMTISDLCRQKPKAEKVRLIG